MQVSEGQQVQIVQAAAAQGQAQTAQAQGQTMQVMQQIITNTGEIQQIPVRDHVKLDKKWWELEEGLHKHVLVNYPSFDGNHQTKVNSFTRGDWLISVVVVQEEENGCDLCVPMTFALNQTLSPPSVGWV